MLKRHIMSAMLCVSLLLSGCGGDSSSEDKISASNTDNSVTAVQILDALEEKGYDSAMDARAVYGDESFNGACEKLYGVTADSLTDGGIIYDSTGSTADEVSLIKASDDSVDCEELLNNRIQARIKDFEGYKPDELGKIESAEVFSCGDLWVLVISDDPEKIKQDILSVQ